MHRCLSLVSATALIAAASLPSTATAMEWSNDDVSVRLSLFMQPRLESGIYVRDRDGEQADLSGETTDDPQWADASFRRLRLTMRGAYQEDTRFNLVLSADRLGEHRSSRDDDDNLIFQANDGGNIGVLYAWVSHRWQRDTHTHTLKFGKDFALFNPSQSDSSARMLFASNRPTAVFSSDNTLGLSYRWQMPAITIAADVHNPRNDSRNVFASARVETSIRPEWSMGRSESRLGAEGFGHILGLSLGLRSDNHSDDDGYIHAGIDYNVHYGPITANVDAIIRRVEANGPKNAGSSATNQWGINLQAGYAMPRDNGHIIEPALRFAAFDMGHSLAPDMSDAAFESVDSGVQGEIGCNYYLNGHNHKIHIGVSHWQANRGDAEKTVLRIQHQLLF